MALNFTRRGVLKGGAALSADSITGLPGMASDRKQGQPLTEPETLSAFLELADQSRDSSIAAQKESRSLHTFGHRFDSRQWLD